MSKPYEHFSDIHTLESPREVVPMLLQQIKPTSVLDVGCGTGTWLKVLDEHGVHDYVGLDGDFVERSQLLIDASRFQAHDLAHPFSLHRVFDLVICLEVAEHLPASAAPALIDSLCLHGEVIVFSAAVPGQGGQNHINEQWPDYWVHLFAKRGFYVHDTLRPMIWDNPRIAWWYRQNMLVFSKVPSTDKPMRLVHPDCYRENLERLTRMNEDARSGRLGVRPSFAIFARSIASFLKK